MIKIENLGFNPKLDFSKIKERTRANIKVQYLTHNAFDVSLIRSDGNSHELRVGGERVKLDTDGLLSLLVKVYPTELLEKMNYSTNDIFDFIDLAFSNVSGLSLEEGATCRWVISMQKDTFKILDKIFGSASKGVLNNHVNKFIQYIIEKRYESDREKVKSFTYWTIYKLINTEKNKAIQILIHTEDFKPIANLLFIDFLFEVMYNLNKNEQSGLGHGIFSNSYNSDREKILARILDNLGRLSANYNSFNNVFGIMEMTSSRFGLPTYIVRNILEDRYGRKEGLGDLNSNFLAYVMQQRDNFMSKVIDFLRYQESIGYSENSMIVSTPLSVASVGKLPEPAIVPSAPIRDGIVDDFNHKDNNTTYETISFSVIPENKKVILYKDLTLRLQELKQRFSLAKEDNTSNLTAIINDTRKLHEDVILARLDSRLDKATPDNSFDLLENECIELGSKIHEFELNGRSVSFSESKWEDRNNLTVDDKSGKFGVEWNSGLMKYMPRPIQWMVGLIVGAFNYQAYLGDRIKSTQAFNYGIFMMGKVFDLVNGSISMILGPLKFLNPLGPLNWIFEKSGDMKRWWKYKDFEIDAKNKTLVHKDTLKKRAMQRYADRKNMSNAESFLQDSVKGTLSFNPDIRGFYEYSIIPKEGIDFDAFYEEVKAEMKKGNVHVSAKKSFDFNIPRKIHSAVLHIVIPQFNKVVDDLVDNKAKDIDIDMKKVNDMKKRFLKAKPKMKQEDVELIESFEVHLDKLIEYKSGVRDVARNIKANDKAKMESYLPNSNDDTFSKRDKAINVLRDLDNILMGFSEDKKRLEFLNSFYEANKDIISKSQYKLLDDKASDLINGEFQKKLVASYSRGYGEKYEINNGIYELYGPEERAFNEPKDVVSVCYRLMWNLKNTGMIKDFSEIRKISFATIDSKLYCLIMASKPHIFDLSKVYTPIPDILNNKKIEVAPDGHNINVLVNKEAASIRSHLMNVDKNVDDNTLKNEPAEDEKEVDANTVKEEILGKDDISDDKREEVMDEFEENLKDKLEENGLLPEEDNEDINNN